MKQILLATDFSPCAEKAAEAAANLAKKLEADLDILYVFDPSVLDFGVTHFSLNGVSQWAEQCIEAQKIKEQQLQELFQKLGAREKYFEEGKSAKKIVSFAKEKEYDLVVMGSHGYGALDRFVIGSVSDYVTRNATCAVLIIKSKDE